MVCLTAVLVQKSEPVACTGSYSYSGSLLPGANTYILSGLAIAAWNGARLLEIL